MYVVVDARAINSSGIGRFLKEAIRALLVNKTDADRVLLLGIRQEIETALPDSTGYDTKHFDLPMYDPRVQFAIPSLVPDCDVFLSPHIDTTRLRVRTKKRITVVHDVFHLSPLAHLSPIRRLYARFLYASAVKVSDVVICVSATTAAELARHFPKAAAKTAVVHNGVDRRLFRSDAPIENQLDESDAVAGFARDQKLGNFALFVGNLKPHKNLECAIKAIDLCHNIKTLVVVGAKDGFITGMGTELEKLLSGPRVRFAGKVDDQALVRLYSGATCLVFPTLHEGFGFPPVEAMACNCPVVCSNIPVLREVCSDAVLFADPKNPESFSREMDNIASNASFASSLKQKGRERSKEFDIERFRRNFAALCWEMV